MIVQAGVLPFWIPSWVKHVRAVQADCAYDENGTPFTIEILLLEDGNVCTIYDMNTMYVRPKGAKVWRKACIHNMVVSFDEQHGLRVMDQWYPDDFNFEWPRSAVIHACVTCCNGYHYTLSFDD